MKKQLMGAALILALAAPAAAMAQDNHEWQGRHQRDASPRNERAQQPGGHWNRGPAPATAQPAVRAQSVAPAQTRSWEGRSGGNWSGGWRGQAQTAQPAQQQTGRWAGGWRGQPQAVAPAQAAPNRWTGEQRGAWRGQENGAWRQQNGDSRQRQGEWRGREGGEWRGRTGEWNRGRAWRGNPSWFRGEGRRAFNWQGRTFYRYRVEPYRWPGGYSYRYAWRAGEYLPRAFFLEDYFLPDYYDFGLWEPEPGAEWIRVGDDAVLVDVYSGQIIDVVPGVFYWD